MPTSIHSPLNSPSSSTSLRPSQTHLYVRLASMNPSFSTHILLLLLLAAAEAFTEFNVGDREGWRVPDPNDTDAFIHWAERNRFKVGDSLRFQYANDSVLLVDKYGFYHCKTDAPIASFNDGNTAILLERPGLVYFISGEYEHCSNGQRLIVDVMSNHSRSYPPLGSISPGYGPELGSASARLADTRMLLPGSVLFMVSVLFVCV